MALMAFANLVDRIALSTIYKNCFAYAFFVGVLNAFFSLVLLLLFPFTGSTADAAFCFAAGAFMGVATLAWSRALSQGEASRLVPFFNVFPLATLGFATLFLGEKLSTLQTAGVFIAVAGAILITIRQRPSISKKRLPVFEAGASLMLLGAVSWGANETLQKAALANISFLNVWSFAGLGVFAVTTTALASYGARREVAAALKNRKFLIPSLNELVYFAAELMLSAAFAMSLVSIASAAETVKLVFIFVFAAAISRLFPKRLKEDLSGRALAVKLAATALIALGIYLAAF
jgi:drug/metabolite transporter (DMT)-like permease